LHPILFRPMLHHVLDLATGLSDGVGVVVGHESDQVKQQCQEYKNLKFFLQSEQRGTAHAVQMATELLVDPDIAVLPDHFHARLRLPHRLRVPWPGPKHGGAWAETRWDAKLLAEKNAFSSPYLQPI